jgi:hypothetical protein
MPCGLLRRQNQSDFKSLFKLLAMTAVAKRLQFACCENRIFLKFYENLS